MNPSDHLRADLLQKIREGLLGNPQWITLKQANTHGGHVGSREHEIDMEAFARWIEHGDAGSVPGLKYAANLPNFMAYFDDVISVAIDTEAAFAIELIVDLLIRGSMEEDEYQMRSLRQIQYWSTLVQPNIHSRERVFSTRHASLMMLAFLVASINEYKIETVSRCWLMGRHGVGSKIDKIPPVLSRPSDPPPENPSSKKPE